VKKIISYDEKLKKKSKRRRAQESPSRRLAELGRPLLPLRDLPDTDLSDLSAALEGRPRDLSDLPESREPLRETR